MKRLNNKGFTLIELLAVIVILAIIMVVTIPTVLSSIDTARVQTFKNSANTIAKWVEDQYGLAQLGMADSAFLGVCNNDNVDNLLPTPTKAGNGQGYCAYRSYNSAYMVSRVSSKATATVSYQKKISTYSGSTNNAQKLITMLKAAGVDPDNYSSVYIRIKNGRACVRLTASDDGSFKQLLVTSVDGTVDTNVEPYRPLPNDVVAYSTGCTI